MGQALKANLGCNWDCINRDKEESCTVNYPINNVRHPKVSSSNELNSIPILFPKMSRNTSFVEIENNEISSRNDNEGMHLPLSSDVSDIIFKNNSNDNTSHHNNSNTITKIDSQTKTLNVKSKDFFKDTCITEKNKISKDIFNPAYIQSIFKGKQFRKKFKGMKSTLRIQSEAIRNCLLNSFDKKEFKYIEVYAPYPFTHDGYLKDEEAKDYIPFNLFGTIVQNRTIVCNYNGTKALYCGSMNFDNQRHGYGILYTSFGQKYEGQWINNNFSGWGRLIEIKEDKSVTEGIFINRKIDGFGKKYWCDKRYRGEFKDGKMEGMGIEECNIYRYEGEYKDNQKNGQGKMIYSETHDVYEGDFKNNCLTGYGLYKWNNKHTYLGEFLNGNMHGKGKYEWPEGGYYEGEYKDNKKEGFGIFKWPDGKIYTGPFKNGQPDGVGKLVSKNKEMDVEFKDGRIVNPNKKMIK